MREVPVSFESLLENNGDPSHVFFTHHGVLAKRDDSVPISLHLTPEGREQGVFTFQVKGPAFPIVKLLPPAMLWWVLPCCRPPCCGGCCPAAAIASCSCCDCIAGAGACHVKGPLECDVYTQV